MLTSKSSRMNNTSVLFLGPFSINDSEFIFIPPLLAPYLEATAKSPGKFGNVSHPIRFWSIVLIQNLLGYALVSITLPIVDNTDHVTVLGFMTVVAAATSLIDATTSREGLADTGYVFSDPFFAKFEIFTSHGNSNFIIKQLLTFNFLQCCPSRGTKSTREPVQIPK